MKMKPHTIAIGAFACAIMTGLVVKAGTDCPEDHPNISCAHATTSGTEPCDSAVQAAVCTGATEGPCATAIGRTVEQFPHEIADNSSMQKCNGSDVPIDRWSGHHKITTAEENCSQGYGCKWNPQGNGSCVKDDATTGQWNQKAKKTSAACN